MSKTPEGFPDLMGEPINTDDYLITVIGESNTLSIVQVAGFTPKRMKIRITNTNTSIVYPSSNRYLKIPAAWATMYLLKNK